MPTLKGRNSPTTYHLPPTSRGGFTILELMLVILAGAILAGILSTGLAGYRNRLEFTNTSSKVVALLREAQSRSVARESSVAWGVHFENSTGTTPFFALFSGAYSTSTHAGYYAFPASVAYVTSSLGAGSSTEIIFAQITGASSASTTIAIQMRSSGVSSTIAVASSGVVSY